MSRRYSRASKRSSRRRVYQAELLSVGGDGPARSVAVPLPAEAFLGDLRESIKQFAGQAGLQLMLSLIEQEVVHRVGPRYQRDRQRQASRWGQETGYVVWSGRKVAVKRPRVRDQAGQELPLASYQQFQQDGPLQREVADRVLAGVSMRKYDQAVDDLCEGYGISKSAVSRQWRAASGQAMRQLCERRLDELDLAVLMIDGIHLGQFLLIAALGIDAAGVKHVLGLWQGATENAEVCSGLLDDLVARGLRSDVKYLFVLDGAKALSKAVRGRFGSEADIQRCQVHKERNVLEHLPRRYQSAIRRRLRAAWGMKDYGLLAVYCG